MPSAKGRSTPSWHTWRVSKPSTGDRVAKASSSSTELLKLRGRIDAIDRQLRTLLNNRAACAEEVARLKTRLDADAPAYYRPDREAEILARLRAENEGPLPDAHIERLFREIISCCLSLEQPLTIACLGPSGTYTEAAAIKQFGHFAKMRTLSTVADVFREVESGAAHYGVVAVENSTDGMVKHTLDCFTTSSLSICAEVELPIHHALLIRRGGDPEEIVEICSHEQSLAQCRHWLDVRYPTQSRRPVSSNAEAARIAADTDGVAAIAGEAAADRYGLDTVHANIEDQPGNKTRFFVVGNQQVEPTGRDRTSIIVSTRNEPGALYKVLAPFKRHDISLSRIESRPSQTSAWDYVFFIDFEGHRNDDSVTGVLAELNKVATGVKNLGSYPRALD
ncbi:MAG: prephenate dehydratase [Gammaproteobacteria bacterium]|nr:prephenate dehydratase [Gammaproteobacteria bacterium]MYK46474.1 prephenate dehydratase [Gammaproteobacteria bacterium]